MFDPGIGRRLSDGGKPPCVPLKVVHEIRQHMDPAIASKVGDIRMAYHIHVRSKWKEESLISFVDHSVHDSSR